MSEGTEKLQEDLGVLEAMVAEMADYLQSDVLFWPMVPTGMPKLTLGGYLMRVQRLQALANLLSEADRKRVETAVNAFNDLTQEKVVRLEERAHTELEARIRQWGEALNEFKGETSLSYYRTAVEARLMIELLVHKLQSFPFQLNPRIMSQVKLLDLNLSNKWQRGDFIWSEEWQPAYPQSEFWWLYGRPK